MSVDLHLMIVARNHAVKLQEELVKQRQNWQKQVWALQEAYEELEAERNALNIKLQEAHERLEAKENKYQALWKRFNNEDV